MLNTEGLEATFSREHLVFAGSEAYTLLCFGAAMLSYIQDHAVLTKLDGRITHILDSDDEKHSRRRQVIHGCRSTPT